MPVKSQSINSNATRNSEGFYLQITSLQKNNNKFIAAMGHQIFHSKIQLNHKEGHS